MSEAIVDVMLHIKESLQKPVLDSIIDGLLMQQGVTTACYQDGTPHLMIVSYDSETTSSSKLLESVESKGLHVKLVGL